MKMKSKKYTEIIRSVENSISQGKLDSLLNRMQFDYQPNNLNEFSNYLVILMALMEKGNYEISNNIFLRKVINSSNKIDSLVVGVTNKFDVIKANTIFPFIGISNTIASLIIDLIDGSENVNYFKDKVPEKVFLVRFNLDLLKMYFEEVTDDLIFRSYIRLLYNCIENMDYKTREISILMEAAQFFKEVLITKKDIFDNYLYHFLREGGMNYSVPNYSSLQIVPEPFFVQIFDSIDEFEKLINLSSSKVKEDLIEFLSKYRVNKKVYLEDLSFKREKHKLL